MKIPRKVIKAFRYIIAVISGGLALLLFIPLSIIVIASGIYIVKSPFREESEYMKYYNIPEVKECIDAYDKFPPEDCMLRVKVGDLKLEFPLRRSASFGRILDHEIAHEDKKVRYSGGAPKSKQLSPYISVKGAPALFVPVTRLSFNVRFAGSKDENFAPLGQKYWESVKDINWEDRGIWFSFSYINIRHRGARYKIPTHNETKDSFFVCDTGMAGQGPRHSWGNYIFKNEKITQHRIKVYQSVPLTGGKVCGAEFFYEIQNNVYVKFYVHFPAKNLDDENDKGWTDEDWGRLIAAVDAYVESTKFKDD